MISPETFRPRYHFTPLANWMNDPNGLVYHDGRYHLFYQHNPYATHWGHMSWGHAVSADLVRWKHMPLAIPEQLDEGYTIFSGSAVIDTRNTSGWGRNGVPPMVAVYTADYRDPPLQTIHVAYSTDGGRTFALFGGNPIIDEGERKFGDPKVFWHAPTRRWVMVAICGHQQGHVILYSSEDLKTWTRLDEFHAPSDAPGIWECPDLFPLRLDGVPDQVRWVLKVNCIGAPDHAPVTRYFLGDFDGAQFTVERVVGRSLTSDNGAIYAEVTYNGVPDGRRILLGWLREQPHPQRPWTGAQSLPRVLTLRSGPQGPELCQRPIVDPQGWRRDHVELGERAFTGTGWLPLRVDLSQRSLEVRATFELDGAESVGVGLTLSDGTEVALGYDAISGRLFIEPGDGRRIATSVLLAGDIVTLRVFLDQAILEVFTGEGGLDVPGGVTAFAPFGTTYTGVGLFARGGAARLWRADAWRLARGGP